MESSIVKRVLVRIGINHNPVTAGLELDGKNVEESWLNKQMNCV